MNTAMHRTDRHSHILFRLHIDGPLTVGLLLMAAVSLMLLYAASGDIALVQKQSVRVCLAFTAMFILAQFRQAFTNVGHHRCFLSVLSCSLVFCYLVSWKRRTALATYRIF